MTNLSRRSLLRGLLGVLGGWLGFKFAAQGRSVTSSLAGPAALLSHDNDPSDTLLSGHSWPVVWACIYDAWSRCTLHLHQPGAGAGTTWPGRTASRQVRKVPQLGSNGSSPRH